MIRIEHPYLELHGKETFLCAKIKDELRDKEYLTWYSVDKEYGQYLCDDRADAFLLVVFMIAMKSGQDIQIDAPVSTKLLFHLNNTIQPLFTKIIPGSKIISIYAQPGDLTIFEGNAVGCGCSLGVDSLSAFYKHCDNSVDRSYRVSHLALYNSCQFGYTDLEETEKAFKAAVNDLQSFSDETGLPIVAVNTNLNELYLNSGFTTAASRFIPSTISCTLALQKLWGKYVFASSYSITEFMISQADHSHSESAFVPLLSTESTEIILSSAVMTRVEKTDFIRHFPLTAQYLDVCWADQMKRGKKGDDRWLKDKTKKNCGWCDKCLRTLFTLELLGEDITAYDSLFDLDKYYKNKEDFIKTVYLNRDTNIMYQEIYELILRVNYPISKEIVRIEKRRSLYRKLSYLKSLILK